MHRPSEGLQPVELVSRYSGLDRASPPHARGVKIG